MNNTNGDSDFGQFWDNYFPNGLSEGDFPYELSEGDIPDESFGIIEPDDSPKTDNHNNHDRHELESNNDVSQSPASSSSNDILDRSPHQSPIRIKQKRKKRENYGKGPENQKLQKMPHFGQPFKHLYFYGWLGRPKKKWLIEIGRKYNDDFEQEIMLKRLPKFTRNHSRRLDLAYFFFDDNKAIIIPWLTKIGMNPPNF